VVGTNATLPVTTSSLYTVKGTAANGCTGTDNIRITEDKAYPTAGITTNTGTQELTCTTTSLNLTATGNGTYAWSHSLGSNATVTVTDPDTYTVNSHRL
jgi:hypothetical protein